MAKQMLQSGMSSLDVAELQRALNETGGYNLATDGIYGPKTTNAVKDFQRQSGIRVDGIFGEKSWAALDRAMSLKNNAAGTNNNVAPPNAAPTLTPTSTTPTYDTSTWDESGKGSAAWEAYVAAQNALKQYGDFAFSENDWLTGLKNQIKNYGEFTYDVNSDALYQQYADQYTRMGKMAMEDTMGQAAAMTGGYGNSYASTAGNQAYQAYLQQLNDKVPELYKLALDKHNMGKQDLYDQYGMLLSEYEREFGEHTYGYDQLLKALGIASDDYYKGGDLFYTEQDNKNSVLGQEFADSMALKEYDLNERQVSLQEQAYEDSKKATIGNTGNTGNNGNTGNQGNTGNTGGTVDATTVPDSVRQKAASYESNTDLANYLDGLEASGVISPQQSDALYAEFVDVNEKYNVDKFGKETSTVKYYDMVRNGKGWTVVDKGGGNLLGIDANARVKTPTGETLTLDQLRKKLIAEGINKRSATQVIKDLQQQLGISSNWFFGA